MMTIKQVAERLGWSYSTAYRHFQQLPGVIIKPGLQSRGRTKRTITIPPDVFEGEYRRLTVRDDLVMAAGTGR